MRLFLLLTLIFAVTACGQMGPLYLPQDKPAQDGQATNNPPANEPSKATTEPVAPQP